MTVLVVDGANVVGSVPDGWWRDRAGAAARLHAALVEGIEVGARVLAPFDEVVLVLEGRARAGASAGRVGAVVTVHAADSGDDEVAARCLDLLGAGVPVTVASADRGLIARVPGVELLGPRTLRSGLATAAED